MHSITLHHCSYLIFTHILHSYCRPSPLTPSIFSSLLSFLFFSIMFLSFPVPPFFPFLPTSQHHAMQALTFLPPSPFSLPILLLCSAPVTPLPPYLSLHVLVSVLLASHFDLPSLSRFLYFYLPSPLVSSFCSYPFTVSTSPLFLPLPSSPPLSFILLLLLVF